MADQKPPSGSSGASGLPLDVSESHQFADSQNDDYAESVRSLDTRQDPFTDSAGVSPVSSEPDSAGTLSDEYAHPSSSTLDQSSPQTVPNQDTLISRTHSHYSTASYPSPSESEVGPSHPYSMYPQELAISRSASAATASTVRGPYRNQTGGQDPSHAYGAYPQTVEMEPLQDNSQRAFPIGFPGHQQQYHRRRGPEGEEQDIVGPDGHAEQLPPYSRYPEQHVIKSAASGGLPAIGEAPAFAEAIQMPGSANENRDRAEPPASSGFSSDGDTLTQTNNSDERLTGAERGDMEKRWREKPWKQRWKSRVCGCIPLWVLALIIMVILLIIVICAAFITVFVTHQNQAINDAVKKAESSLAAQPTTTTSYLDAAPIPTPAGLPSLAQGTYVVPFGDPTATYEYCLDSKEDKKAWTCMFPKPNENTVTISYDERNEMQISTGLLGGTFLFGEQPPPLINQSLVLVTDLENRTLGDAYHFQTFYDKIVILPKAAITPTETLPPYHEPTSPGGMTDHYAHEAWFCVWNNTFIEGFIYIDRQAIKTSPLVTTGNGEGYPQPTESEDSTFSIHPTSNVHMSSAPTMPPSSKPPSKPSTPVASSTPTPTRYSYHAKSLYMPSSSSSTYINGDPTKKRKRQQTTFPHRMKLTERRLAGTHPQPYCTLMKIPWNGTPSVAMWPHGGPITVQLNETDPTHSYNFGGQSMEPRAADDKDKGCYCQWMV